MQQVNAGFWRPFQAAAGGIHAIGEVFNGDPAYTCPYQGQLSGVMNYPTFYTITNAFRSTNGDIQSLVNGINRMKVESTTALFGCLKASTRLALTRIIVYLLRRHPSRLLLGEPR
jgi:alpha-amylase